MSRNRSAKSKPELGLFWCSRHKELLDRDSFYANKRASLGVASVCKACSKQLTIEQRAKDPEKHNAAVRRFRQSAKGAAYIAQWEAQNKEHRAAWRAGYLVRKLTLNRERAMLKSSATPLWVDKLEVRKLYIEAKTRTRETGVQYDVDHIIPLKGKTVCGLHVASNLQVVTADANRRKHNKFHQV